MGVEHQTTLCRPGTAWSAFPATVIVVALTGFIAPFVHASEEARAWLKRMSEASKTLNYEGTFVYRQGAHMESVRIIHRADDDGEKERLVSLNGEAREVLRDQSQVTCIMPDNHAVVVDSRHNKNRLAPSFDVIDARLEAHYVLAVHGSERIAGRSARLISIKPRDEFRYGYSLWLDKETALLLRSELLDGQQNVLEQVLYTSVSMHETIPDTMLEPDVSGKGLVWYTTESPDPALAEVESAWSVEELPAGFLLKSSDKSLIANSPIPVRHMVFSDGLASFSIYIEKLSDEKEPFEGFSEMGAVSAFGRIVDGYQITAVGEVPKATVERAGVAVRRE